MTFWGTEQLFSTATLLQATLFLCVTNQAEGTDNHRKTHITKENPTALLLFRYKHVTKWLNNYEIILTFYVCTSHWLWTTLKTFVLFLLQLCVNTIRALTSTQSLTETFFWCQIFKVLAMLMKVNNKSCHWLLFDSIRN